MFFSVPIMKFWQPSAITTLTVLFCLSFWVPTATSETKGTTVLVHEWTSLDYEWPSDADRTEALRNGSFVPERNLLTGLKIYKGEVYVSIPRWIWTSGQPVTLAKVVTVQGQAKLRPYPDWAAQKQGDCQALQFVQSMEIDPNTGLMYVIDVGRVGLIGDSTPLDLCPAKIVVYDLKTDDLVGSYELPASVVSRNSNWMNDLVLDYVDGKVRYAYITDVADNRLYVYDFQTNSAHSLADPSMNPEGNNGTIITIDSKNYPFDAGLDGIAMSPDFKYVYYCPIGGYNLYQIPTQTLRQGRPNDTTGLRLVGRKVSQSDGLTYGTQHLFFGALGLNALYYWDAAKDMADQRANIDTVNMKTQTMLVGNDQLMQWPDTLAIDELGWLWVMSNRVQLFQSRQMDFSGGDGSNMRVWKVFVNETGYLHQADMRTRGPVDTIVG